MVMSCLTYVADFSVTFVILLLFFLFLGCFLLLLQIHCTSMQISLIFDENSFENLFFRNHLTIVIQDWMEWSKVFAIAKNINNYS